MQHFRSRLGDVSHFALTGSTDFGVLNGVVLLGEYRQQAGPTFILVGSATTGAGKIQVFNGADITGAAVLAPTREYPWTYCTWLDTFYFSNKIDGPYKWTGAGNIAALGGTPPAFWHINVLKDHLCGLGVGTATPQRFAWGDEGSDSVWTAAATNSAGSFDLIDSPDWATGLHQFGDDLIAYFENRIVPITWIGGNDVFARRRAVTDTGLVSHYALASFSDAHYGMGKDFFWKYTGGSHVDDSIGDAIRERVYGSFNQNLRRLVRCMVYRDTFEIIWCYPDGSATVSANQAVVYNWKENEWYGGPMNIAGEFTTSVSNGVDMMLSTVETIETVVIDDDDRIIDTVNTIIDAPQTGGLTYNYLVGIDNGSILYLSENITLTEFTGNNFALRSGDQFIGAGAVDEFGQSINFPRGTVFQVIGIVLEVEADPGTTINFGAGKPIQFSVGSRMELNDSLVWQGPYDVVADSTKNIFIPVRLSGRWFRVRFLGRGIGNENSYVGTSFNLHGYQYIFTTMGVR